MKFKTKFNPPILTNREDIAIKISILLIMFSIFSSCIDKINLPLDSESRGVRSEPPKSLEAKLKIDGGILFGDREMNTEVFGKALRGCRERYGSSFILILEVDKEIQMKSLYKIFTIANDSGINKFAFVVQEKNGFKNYRHFQTISKKQLDIKQKEEGEIYFRDSSLTVQIIVSKISSQKEKLPEHTYYSYYVVFEKLEND